jgi:hypothetical protein
LALAEFRAPELASTGATLSEIERTVLNEPGVSPALRDAILAIERPTDTLPVPVPASAVSRTLTVAGGPALAIQRHGQALLLWHAHGFLSILTGRLPLATLVAIADRLAP